MTYPKGFNPLSLQGAGMADSSSHGSPISMSSYISVNSDIPKTYYHIAVSSDIPEAKSSIEFDCERGRVEEIINKYNDFKEFDCEQRIFHPADVTQILVYSTKYEIEHFQTKDSNNKVTDSSRAYKNSDKWNNIVLRHGTLMNESFNTEIPKPSLAEVYKLARKRSITNSIDTINDFSKTMITLVSGFFIAYFALIKFLGVQNVSNYTQTILLLPPIFFIMGIISLIISLMPLYFEISKKDPKEITTEAKQKKTIEGFARDVRNKIFYRKYIPMIIGMTFFVIGLGFTIAGSFQLFMQLPRIH
jgi:hypothetical protein